MGPSTLQGALPPYWKSTPAPNLQWDQKLPMSEISLPNKRIFSFPWFSHDFPMVFPWFSHGFPMIFPKLSLDFQSFFLSGTLGGEPPKVLNPMPQTSPNQGVFLLPPISAKCGPQTIAKLVNITPNFTMFYDIYMCIYIWLFIYIYRVFIEFINQQTSLRGPTL